MNILVFSTTFNHSSAQQRSVGPFSLLEKEDKITCKYATQYDWTDFLYADIVYMTNPYFPVELEVAKTAKQMGIPLIVDYDDDYLNLANYNTAFNTFTPHRQNYIEILTLASEVWAVTKYLAKTLSNYNRNTYFIPNGIDSRFFKTQTSSINKTIVWRGCNSHIFDLNDVRDDLVYLSQKYPEWQLHFISQRPTSDDTPFKYTFHPHRDILGYHKLLEELNPEIVIVPLRDSQFNRCKAFQAWLEGTWVGATVVCPDFKAWQVPGAVNYKQGNFRQTVEQIIQQRDPKFRVQALEYIKQNLLVEKVNDIRLERFKSLTTIENSVKLIKGV